MLTERFRQRAKVNGWQVVGGANSPIDISPISRKRDLRKAIAATDGPAIPFTGSSTEWILEVLARRAPILMLIDSYRDGTPVADWFEQRIVPGLLRSGAPVVVVISRPDGDSHGLGSLATDVVELRELDEHEVRVALERLAPLIDPPFDPSELEVYVREARIPATVDSLIRVLALAIPPERSG